MIVLESLVESSVLVGLPLPPSNHPRHTWHDTNPWETTRFVPDVVSGWSSRAAALLLQYHDEDSRTPKRGPEAGRYRAARTTIDDVPPLVPTRILHVDERNAIDVESWPKRLESLECVAVMMVVLCWMA